MISNHHLWFFGVATAFKLLLVPSYHSTDLHVHRNWLAITSSLPLSQWYSHSDPLNPWTLDYPPLFALFQLLLSFPAKLFDYDSRRLLDLYAPADYASPSALLFLRLSVAVCDLTLLLAVSRYILNNRYRQQLTSKHIIILALIFWSPALFIVDHMHFQYNGYLLGILLLSLGLLEQGRDLAGGFVFAVLICSKHLFMVAAPVYFVYLFRHYCCGVGGFWRGFYRLVLMGAAVAIVFAVSFGPFFYHGQMQQMLSRLFPFGRGLCHAYWAPNIWVFYIVLDKMLAFVLGKMGFQVATPKASFTGGLVGDSSPFSVLSEVSPLITFLLVLAAMFPCLVKAFQKPQPKHIIRWVAYAFTCGFIFGWHVHEKASLHFVIPLGIIAADSLDDARHYFFLSIVSCYSLFPLLFEAQEYPIKVLLLAIHAIIMWIGFSSYFCTQTHPTGTKNKGSSPSGEKNRLVGWIGALYLLGLLAVELWGQLFHSYIFGDRLPFLPLMLISIYCSFGMLYSWLWQLTRILRHT